MRNSLKQKGAFLFALACHTEREKTRAWSTSTTFEGHMFWLSHFDKTNNTTGEHQATPASCAVPRNVNNGEKVTRTRDYHNSPSRQNEVIIQRKPCTRRKMTHSWENAATCCSTRMTGNRSLHVYTTHFALIVSTKKRTKVVRTGTFGFAHRVTGNERLRLVRI